MYLCKIQHQFLTTLYFKKILSVILLLRGNKFSQYYLCVDVHTVQW